MTRITLPRRPLVRALATAAAGVLAAAFLAVGPLRHAIFLSSGVANPATPGNFYGYGFDQCRTPSQDAMNHWLARSPYLAAGVYISGDERACQDQPNLTATWVHTQLAKGWRLLPITVGPQASCNTHFRREPASTRIRAAAGKQGTYTAAATQGTTEAQTTVKSAQSLGLIPGSTMFYDLENFDASNTACRESALRFLSSWTRELHHLGYLSGVYSSGNSGIKALDQARRQDGGRYTMPDQIWIADWDGKPGTSSSYVSSTGWAADARVKQYEGGHVETWGKISIDVDDDFLDLGKGTVAPPDVHCGGITVSLPSYPAFGAIGAKPAPSSASVKAVKCLLQEQGVYRQRTINGIYGTGLAAAMTVFERAHHLAVRAGWTRSDWVAALSAGTHAIVKYGSGSSDVYALQRALDAANPSLHLPMTGVDASLTTAAVKAYQKKMGIAQTGNATSGVWQLLAAGRH